MITNNIITMLLVSLTLAQNSWAKGANLPEDLCLLKTKHEILQPSEKDYLLIPSTQLLKFTSNGLQELTLNYTHGAKGISEQLLTNQEILSSQSVKILEFKQNLTKFEEKYYNCDGLDALFNLAELYSNTTSFYYELEDDSLDNDTKLILDLLRKYKSEVLDDEFEKYFDIFVENFLKKFESLKENLNKEEGQLGKKLSAWFDHFKTLTNYDDKIEAFEKYFQFYD